MKSLKSTKGFTLVELIVVIAILGILAAVAVPAYSGYVEKANEASDYTQLDAIKTAATVAYTENQIAAGSTDTDIENIYVAAATTGASATAGAVYVNIAGTAPTSSETAIDVSEYYDSISSLTFKSGATSAFYNGSAWALND